MTDSTVLAQWVSLTAITVLVGAVGGCGSSRPIVEGVVTLDGTPIDQGTIRWVPARGKGQTAGASIRAGRYRTEASPGVMKVLINCPRKDGTMPDPAGGGGRVDRFVESVPERYNDATELEVTVVPGRNTFDFTLEGGGSPAVSHQDRP